MFLQILPQASWHDGELLGCFVSVLLQCVLEELHPPVLLQIAVFVLLHCVLTVMPASRRIASQVLLQMVVHFCQHDSSCLCYACLRVSSRHWWWCLILLLVFSILFLYWLCSLMLHCHYLSAAYAAPSPSSPPPCAVSSPIVPLSPIFTPLLQPDKSFSLLFCSCSCLSP